MKSIKNLDWVKIERYYKGGLVSVNKIAQMFGCTEGNIRYRAKKLGWKRDVAIEVQQRGRRLQIENLANIYKPHEDRIEEMMDEQLIEEAARTQVEVIRQHQSTIKNAHSLAIRMLDELDATTSYKGEIEKIIQEHGTPSQRAVACKRVLSLGGRITNLRDLAQSVQILTKLERQAFNIVDETRDKASDPIDNMTAEELRAEILKDAQKIGLDLTAQDLDEGLGKKMH